MNTTPSLRLFETRSTLAQSVAELFYRELAAILETKARAHVVLTGGTVGGEILAAIGDSPLLAEADWARVEFWWGDERWLPAGDDERNDTLADRALLHRLVADRHLDPSQIHRFPASDAGLSLDAAAEHYARELSTHADGDEHAPRFDLLFLGVGPDGHVASLFPGHESLKVSDAPVIAERNSPKPPPERLSLTFPVLNAAERVWLCLAGSDKAPALALALAGASSFDVPAAGVQGRLDTTFFVDESAAIDLSPELVAEFTAH